MQIPLAPILEFYKGGGELRTTIMLRELKDMEVRCNPPNVKTSRNRKVGSITDDIPYSLTQMGAPSEFIVRELGLA